MEPGKTKTWIINESFSVVERQLELILYEMKRSGSFYYEIEKKSEPLIIIELFTERPITYKQVKEFIFDEEKRTPKKSWGFARLSVLDLGKESRVELKTSDEFLFTEEVEAPLHYLLSQLNDYQKSVNISRTKEKYLTNKRRRGGPVATSEEKKLEYVLGWYDAQDIETQEAYCFRKGFGSSTLRGWERELIAAGKLPPS